MTIPSPNITPLHIQALHARLSNLPTSPLSPLSPNTKQTLNAELAYLPTPPPETTLPANRATIYIPAPIHPEAVKYARERFERVILKGDMEACLAWGMADGVVNRANPVGREVLNVAKRLVGIAVVGVGYDSIDIAGCRDRQIVVTNCPGANADAVAELTLTLTLSLLRRVPELDRRLRLGEKMSSIDNLGRSLRGKVIGIVGMGSTARRAAEIFHHAFACEIHIYSPTSPSSRWTAHDHTAAPLPHSRHNNLESMLPIVDILTLHCPLTDETRNLISTPQFEIMKPGSILVNMSRGAVVDERALCEALKLGQTISAAASDVFNIEPACVNTVEGLLGLDNFIGTPHIGGSTVEAQIDVCYQAIDQLAEIFDGRQVNNRVC